jgi:hypothetical protein
MSTFSVQSAGLNAIKKLSDDYGLNLREREACLQVIKEVVDELALRASQPQLCK